MSGLQNVLVSEHRPGLWHFNLVIDGIPKEPPVATMTEVPGGFKVMANGKEAVVKGSFRSVVQQVGAQVVANDSRGSEDELMTNFFEVMFGDLNILACKKGQLPSYILAMARALGDTLYDDVKDGGQSAVATSFTKAVAERLKERGASAVVVAAVKDLMVAMLTPETKETKH